jgi:subfamily B ATP-binding cassette protein MsbA
VENEITSKKMLFKDAFESDITISNINFKFVTKTKSIKELSLQVKKDKRWRLWDNLVVEKNFANLLTRFYDVNEGTISIDGRI